MNSSKKMYDSLIKNSSNEVVSMFLKDIFIIENSGLKNWNNKYDDLIDNYSEVYSNED